MSGNGEIPARSRAGRAGPIALASVIALVVVVALVVVFARGAAEPLPADSPEGVVQRYSQAVVDGDVATALSYLSDQAADECERVRPEIADRRVSMLKTVRSGDMMRVHVLVETAYETGLFGGDGYRSEEVFELTRRGDGWSIEVAPWQFSVCADQGFS